MKKIFLNTILKFPLILGMLAVIIVIPVSCIEDPESAVAGRGTNRIRIEAEEFAVVTFTPFSTETKSLITIFRDAVSQSAMNESVTVSLEINEDSLDAYNERNETSYLLLDPASYSLNIPAGTVTFAPGEAAKTIRITVNTGLLDLSQKHVLPFVIKNASSGFAVNERLDLTIVQILPINKYDGIYEVTGEDWTDQVNAAIHEFYPFEWYAETTGENSIVFYDPFFETYFHPIANGADRSAYGSFGVEVEFSPTTGLVVDMSNFWGNPAGNTRNLLWSAADGNKWNEADGSMDLKYHMTQSSLVATPPHIRSSFDEHLEYLEPR